MKRLIPALLVLLGLLGAPPALRAAPLADDPTPPAEPVRLIFIHHSTGGHWLADPNDAQPYGELGRALMENNYFVSATNYGWGPDYAGDRTDIPHWPRWFHVDAEEDILRALYTESGQSTGDFGAWPRLRTAPPGENEIVMFKSCFPNSDLQGNPDDPPLDEPGGGLSVANAKAVYVSLLDYFATRPDKLFIVITAPPLAAGETSPARAANARAFNNWLATDWLRDYPHANVAVFDYYNVLTGDGNHHRWNGTAVEHVQAVDSNVAAYAAGDSHPATEGHQKATAEFVPLLNVYVNRWRQGEVVRPAAGTTGTTSTSTTQPTAPPASQPTAQAADPDALELLIDDFEGKPRGGSDRWQPYWDEATQTVITCEPDETAAYAGSRSLRVQHQVAARSWATCVLFFAPHQDWRAAHGLSFYVRADQPDQVFDVNVSRAGPDGQETYVFRVRTTESGPGWMGVEIGWEQFARVEWEPDPGAPLTDLTEITAVAFGVNADPTGPTDGAIWIDGLRLLDSAPAIALEPAAPVEPAEPDQPAEPAEPTPTPWVDEDRDTGLGGECCLGGCATAMAPVGLALWIGGRRLARRPEHL